MSDPRAALEAIGVLPDTEIDIGDAALQLARVDAPDADWQAARAHLSDLLDDELTDNPIRVAGHCYGCTAGQGSSCGGALKEAAE